MNSGSGSAHYYSLDVGLVHLVTFSTEVYWAMSGAVESQLNWLKKDLADAAVAVAAAAVVVGVHPG